MATNNFQNSQTYKNLQLAINGESAVTGRYQIYGNQARIEGFQQIGNIFDETARNEQEHAAIFLKLIIDGPIPPTLTNLQDAAQRENEVGTTIYMQYAQTARDEGYTEIANMFEGIAVIERHHYFRFNSLANNIIDSEVFCKPNSVVWICTVCGNVVWNECAPEICPVCGYPQGYYQLNCENY